MHLKRLLPQSNFCYLGCRKVVGCRPTKAAKTPTTWGTTMAIAALPLNVGHRAKKNQKKFGKPKGCTYICNRLVA